MVQLYSAARSRFVSAATRQIPAAYTPPISLERRLWGLTFRSPLGNAAGMFKNGEAYDLMAAQGAGWYMAGTTTSRPRRGNRRLGITHPFAPYPRSGAASNWMGLPNDGDAAVARRLSAVEKVSGFPLGVSLAASPDVPTEPALDSLAQGMELFESAGADFLEINESCPNTEDGASRGGDLYRRLEVLRRSFLDQRRPRMATGKLLPVLVKLSLDTSKEQVADLVKMLVELGFDGVDFGNTSTAYDRFRPSIAPQERRLFDYFTTRFGGGLSGRPLKARSLELTEAAAAAAQGASREFHVVRTGGVEDFRDLEDSLAAGASLVGWYTGYFAAFGRDGHDLYRRVYERSQET
ncbi:MAG: hypothetical protein KDD47_26015 [Acidobacteria bacterium]|nr:hypothetical protein [Acidobacteriota bacterium]